MGFQNIVIFCWGNETGVLNLFLFCFYKIEIEHPLRDLGFFSFEVVDL